MKNDILAAIQDELPFLLRRFENTRRISYPMKERTNETPNWQKEGYVLFRFRVYISEEQVELILFAYNWAYHTPKQGIIPHCRCKLPQRYNPESLTGEEKQEIFETLTAYIQKIVTDDRQDIFSPLVECYLDFMKIDKLNEINPDYLPAKFFLSSNGFSKTIMKSNTKEHLQHFRDYMQKMRTAEETPFTEMRNALWKIWKYEYNESFKEMRPFLEDCYHHLKEEDYGDQTIRNMIRSVLRSYSHEIIDELGLYYRSNRFEKSYALTIDQVEFLECTVKALKENSDHEDDPDLIKTLKGVITRTETASSKKNENQHK